MICTVATSCAYDLESNFQPIRDKTGKVVTASFTQIVVFWIFTSYTIMYLFRLFGETYCLCLQGDPICFNSPKHRVFPEPNTVTQQMEASSSTETSGKHITLHDVKTQRFKHDDSVSALR